LPTFASKKPQLEIIFDIGSASVGVAVFLLSAGKKSILTFSYREELPLYEDTNFDRLGAAILQAVGNAAQKTIETGIQAHTIAEVKCFLSSPWYLSKTKISKENFETPKEFTEAVMKEIYKRETDKVVNDPELLSSGDTEMLEAENILTKLNGYESSDPFGKKANTIEVALFVSLSSKSVLGSIRSAIKGYFTSSTVKFHSFSFASFVVVRDIFHEKNFLLLDISGESTDVIIVRDNLLEKAVPLPMGRNFFLRGLAKNLGITLAEASSKFRLAESEMLNAEAHKEVLKASSEMGETWRMGLQNIFSELSKESKFLPHNVFVMADDEVARWFIENIQDEGVSQFTLSDGVFIVRHLDAQFLSAFCDSAKGVPRDPFLMLEGVCRG